MKTEGVIMDMTGAEFKRLVEQYDPNGKIDTLPEIIKSLRGLDDKEPLENYLAKDGWADDEDIGQIFD